MTALTQKLAQQHAQAAATQLTERRKRRSVQRPSVLAEVLADADNDDISEWLDEAPVQAVSPSVEEAAFAAETLEPPLVPTLPELAALPSSAPANTAITVSPLDLPTELFSAGLERRKRNRALLMEWLRTALVEGVDFGRIHIAGKERCALVRMGRVHECKDPAHWSKPSLFKPGAEKITGLLGMTVHYPTMPAYEDAILSQIEVRTIMLRCELRDAHGHVVAQGAGARQVTTDWGDLNKTLKMVCKSAHIDATLRLAGLSEVFTQDLEDRPLGEELGEPVMPRSPASVSVTSAAKPPPGAHSNQLIDVPQLQALRQAIKAHDFTEQRVLNWLHKATRGQINQLEQISVPLYASLLKKLDQWADAEAALYVESQHSA